MSLHPAVRKKNIFLIIAAFILLAGLIVQARYGLLRPSGNSSCISAETRLCPDGSYVGRTGSDCEFAACPTGEDKTSYGFRNAEIGKAITGYLPTQRAFAWQTRTGSRNFCVVENLAPEKELFPLYIWARCGEFVRENGSLEELSGVSMPVKIDYPNELSFYDPARFGYEIPGDGAAYAEDIRRIFPQELQAKILGFDSSTVSMELTTQAPVWFQREAENDENWQAIKTAIAECRVESVMQAHSLAVSARLKDGTELSAVEPEIDDIIDLAALARPRCGDIRMATE